MQTIRYVDPEDLISTVAKNVLSGYSNYQAEINFHPKRITMIDAVKQYTGVTVVYQTDEEARQAAGGVHIEGKQVGEKY